MDNQISLAVIGGVSQLIAGLLVVASTIIVYVKYRLVAKPGAARWYAVSTSMIAASFLLRAITELVAIPVSAQWILTLTSLVLVVIALLALIRLITRFGTKWYRQSGR